MTGTQLSITGAFIVALTLTITAIISLMKTRQVAIKVEELHVIVNSRLTELLEMTRRAAASEGFAQGVRESEQSKASPSAQE